MSTTERRERDTFHIFIAGRRHRGIDTPRQRRERPDDPDPTLQLGDFFQQRRHVSAAGSRFDRQACESKTGNVDLLDRAPRYRAADRRALRRRARVPRLSDLRAAREGSRARVPASSSRSASEKAGERDAIASEPRLPRRVESRPARVAGVPPIRSSPVSRRATPPAASVPRPLPRP